MFISKIYLIGLFLEIFIPIFQNDFRLENTRLDFQRIKLILVHFKRQIYFRFWLTRPDRPFWAMHFYLIFIYPSSLRQLNKERLLLILTVLCHICPISPTTIQFDQWPSNFTFKRSVRLITIYFDLCSVRQMTVQFKQRSFISVNDRPHCWHSLSISLIFVCRSRPSS